VHSPRLPQTSLLSIPRSNTRLRSLRHSTTITVHPLHHHILRTRSKASQQSPPHPLKTQTPPPLKALVWLNHRRHRRQTLRGFHILRIIQTKRSFRLHNTYHSTRTSTHDPGLNVNAHITRRIAQVTYCFVKGVGESRHLTT
jgi:hypothetical protein